MPSPTRAANGPRRSLPHALLVGGGATIVCTLPIYFTGTMALQLTSDLNFGAVGIGTAVATAFGTRATASVFLGRMTDRLGAIVALRAAAITGAIGAAGIATTARSLATLVPWMVVAGLASGLSQPAANRLLVRRVPEGRLATAFGIKQSAQPASSMLAGLSVPIIALTWGWRWAYMLSALLALIVVVAIGQRPARGTSSRAAPPQGTRIRLPNPQALFMLGLAIGLAMACSSAIMAFMVDSASSSRMSLSGAAFTFSLASVTALATRIAAGFVCDRTGVDPLRLCAGMLAVGALGSVLLTSQTVWVLVIGGTLALAGTWGFPGVFWFALVRAYPTMPGRITGALAPASFGGMVGPIAFGATIEISGYGVAWLGTSLVAAASALTMLVGASWLVRGSIASA